MLEAHRDRERERELGTEIKELRAGQHMLRNDHVSKKMNIQFNMFGCTQVVTPAS